MNTILVGDFCAIDKNMDLVKNKNLKALFNDTLPLFEGNDLMFVNVECANYPSPRLIKACREMVHNGADVIICQHTLHQLL